MTLDLRRDKEDISISLPTWARAYALAIEGGWEPLGTLPSKYLSEEDKKTWEGNYDSNDGQVITDEDARSMASALETMLGSLGEPVAESERQPGSAQFLARVDDEPADYFKTENKRRVLQALIEFLRGGRAEIW
jgi:hypothetical protein